MPCRGTVFSRMNLLEGYVMELALRLSPQSVLERAYATGEKAPFSRSCAGACIESLLRPFRLLFAFLQRVRGMASAEADARAPPCIRMTMGIVTWPL